MSHKVYFRIKIIAIVIVVLIVGNIMFLRHVHIPYQNHVQTYQQIQNQLISKNKESYNHYFNVYNGTSQTYVIAVKEEKVKFKAYNQKLKLIDSYQNNVYGSQKLIQKINKDNKFDIKKVDVIYDEGEFMYYFTHHSEKHLNYYFYNMATGQLIKAYHL